MLPFIENVFGATALKGKTPQQIDKILPDRGFDPKGTDCASGRKSYLMSTSIGCETESTSRKKTCPWNRPVTTTILLFQRPIGFFSASSPGQRQPLELPQAEVLGKRFQSLRSDLQTHQWRPDFYESSRQLTVDFRGGDPAELGLEASQNSRNCGKSPQS